MNEDLKINKEGNSMLLREFGVQQSAACNGAASALKVSLDVVFEQYVRDQKDLQSKNSDLLDSKRGQMSALDNEIRKVHNSISDKELKISSIEDTIRLKDSEIDDIKESKDAATGIVPFVIGAFIVILLTFYLFVFYSSTGYSALFGGTVGTTSFLNPNVFNEAANKGGGVIAMLVLFPVIFLGLGFLIHDALERKKYFFITLIIFFTFLTDALIGYKISQNIHQAEYQTGARNEEWNTSMIFSDINFYIILALGFVVYLIWGALLHYVLNKYKDISEPERITSLKREIERLRLDINTHREGIFSLKNEISDLEKRKADIQIEIDAILSGRFFIDPSVLDSYVGQFLGGWLSYIGLLHGANSSTATSLMQACVQEKDAWFNAKIAK